MGLFSPAFEAALAASPAPTPFTVVDVTFPAGAGGLLRFTDEATAYGTRLASSRLPGGAIDSVQISVGQRPSDLALQSFTLTFLDTDALLRKKLTGRYDCRRSPIRVMWGLPGVAETDWFTHAVGVLDDWSSSGIQVTLSGTSDDRQLQGFVPRRQILKGWAPNAPQEVLSYYCPIVLGAHNAQALDNKGMVSCVPISISAATGYEYVVSLGIMKSVPRVYKGTTLQTLTTHYTIQTRNLGGLKMTTIRFVSATTADDVITCDVEGLTDTNTTAGTLLTSSIDLLKWFLNNLIYSDWNGDAYSTTAAPLDLATLSITASYCSTFRYEVAFRFGGSRDQQPGIDFLNRWLRSHLMLRMRWSNDGKIGVVPIDHRWTPYAAAFAYTGGSAPGRHAAEDFPDGFRYQLAAAGICSKVSLEYLYGEAAGKFWQTLEVQDLARWATEKVTEKFQLDWSSSRFA